MNFLSATRRCLAVALVAFLVGALAPALAGTTVGTLSYKDCVTDINSDAGCSTGVPATALYGVGSSVLTRDGKTLFVASTQQDDYGTLMSFSVKRSGGLSFGHCVGVTPNTPNCNGPDGSTFSDIQSVAVSRDGRSVYAASTHQDLLLRFAVAKSGKLSLAQCYSNSSADGCNPLAGGVLDGPLGLAVTADGRSLWVGGAGSNDVVRVALNRKGRFQGYTCASTTGNGGVCTDIPGDSLDDVEGVAADPKTDRVYAAGNDPSAVSELRANAKGSIRLDSCVTSEPAGVVCRHAPSVITGLRPIVATADGKSVYAAAEGADAVAHYRTGKKGLRYDSCISDSGSGGKCKVLPGQNFLMGFPNAIAASPDSRSVYVVAPVGRTLLDLAASRRGRLSFQKCFGDSEDEDYHGGVCKSLPGDQLLLTGGAVNVTPNGHFVYMGGRRTVAIFSRRHVGRH